ncbi:MAG: dienelactone hydrolase family protein [Nitrospira sp.]
MTTDSHEADALMNRLKPGIKAAVPFYGQELNPDAPVKNLGCPILYIYGEDDGWITKADVQRLAAALHKYRKLGEIKT